MGLYTVGTANILICTVTIGRTNYRRLNNQPYLTTETSYEDGIWLIVLTIACQIDHGIVLSQYPSALKQSLFQQRNRDKMLHFYHIVNKCLCPVYSTDTKQQFSYSL